MKQKISWTLREEDGVKREVRVEVAAKSIKWQFKRADEDAWLVGLSYSAEGIGLEGLSGFTSYARGTGAQDRDGASLPDQKEWDVTLDYRFPADSLMRGFWLRARYSILDRGSEGSRHETRVILNYEIPLL